MQNKTTWRFHSTSARMAKVNTKNSDNCWCRRGGRGNTGGKQSYANTMEIKVGLPKKAKSRSTMSSSYATFGCIPKRQLHIRL